MIFELYIKNFAIIKDLRIEFTKGLNLLTGETGAGKSIIIEALGIILGGRGTKDLIRTGEDKSILQATFLINNINDPIYEEYGIDIAKDGILTISREINRNYQSISRINGKTATLAVLNQISSRLVDIFAQEEHQSLLNISNHRKLVDTFGNSKFKKLQKNIAHLYIEYSKENTALKDMTMDSNQRNREIDLLRFQIDEIKSANLKVEDEIDIENEYNKLSNIKEIGIGISEIVESLNGFDSQNYSTLNIINKNISIINRLVKYDKTLEPTLNRLTNINFELQDLNSELTDYMNGMELDEEKLVFLGDRIDLINELKRKYGNTVQDILEYKETINRDLEQLINYEEEIKRRKNKIKKLKNILTDHSMKLSHMRKSIAETLEKDIAKELSFLNMNNVIFKINFEKRDNLGPDGIDNIEFLISTNPGESLKPLSKIVSGGEMSRIMLAFKSIFAEHDGIPSLIFDEIDTGISGRTAQIVGEKIYKIAQNRQVILVSHLPQIAALADSHYIISKGSVDTNKITTNVTKLSEEDRVIELGRLLGGVDVTNTTLNHAKEMLQMSKKIKKNGKK